MDCRISVRALVEFILRCGDIERGRGTVDLQAMQKGSRLHRQLQAGMGGTYQAEVSFKRDIEYEDLTIRVEGRADGVYEEDGLVWIDEIKGVRKNVHAMEAPDPVHLAQAKCYALFMAQQRDLPRAGIRMSYVHLDTEEIRYFYSIQETVELKAWFEEVADSYHRWLSFQLSWRRRRDASMAGLDFPFTYREGQRDLVKSIWHTVTTGGVLFAQAPTGTGKTMSAVFPSIRAVGRGYGQTVFYLTAKTSARVVAGEAVRILREKGLLWKTVTLTAKEKLCLVPEPVCDPALCPYARGHYDRINEAVYTLWTGEDCFDRETILEAAQRFMVCPFELSLDLALWVDMVICDYNYVFDPDVCLKRFFGEGVQGEYIFLIDEAHNLVDRAREMYSAWLCREDVMKARRQVKALFPALGRSLGRLSRQLLALCRECEAEGVPGSAGGSWRVLYDLGLLPVTLAQVQGGMEELLEDPAAAETVNEVLDFYFQLRAFSRVLEHMDEHYVMYGAAEEDGCFRLRLMCVEPATLLDERLGKGKAAVFFSASFHPLSYYRALLTTNTQTYGLRLPSPFPRERRLLLMGTDVSTRYRSRGPAAYHRIAEYICATARAREGNYLVFFPSYQLLREVETVCRLMWTDRPVRWLIQAPGMKEEEKDLFLKEFDSADGTLIALAVLGGVFSEGIDLTGEKLIGAVIVGTGLPGLDIRREVLRDYYNRKGRDGFDQAYRIPGMNKVLQAAGRVIRTKEDRGVILLLDERFREEAGGPLFPADMGDIRPCTIRSVGKMLKDFWDGGDEA